MQLCSFLCEFLCEYIHSSWGIYLGVELLVHRVVLCFTFWDTTRLFPKVTASFYILTPVHEGSTFQCPHQHLLLSIFLMIAILVDMKYYLIVIMICIFFMANGVKKKGKALSLLQLSLMQAVGLS